MMLKAAAERGVKIYVIVYKEVEAALTLDSAVSPLPACSVYMPVSNRWMLLLAHQACS